MLHIQLDMSSGVPVYRQVMDQIRYYTASATLKPGDALPSIRDLAQTLHINPATIVKAYSELEHAGDIVVRQGKGTFVAENAEPKSRVEVEREFKKHAGQLAAVAAQLGLSPECAAEILREQIQQIAAKQGAMP